jgi:hypothetical protein
MEPKVLDLNELLEDLVDKDGFNTINPDYQIVHYDKLLSITKKTSARRKLLKERQWWVEAKEDEERFGMERDSRGFLIPKTGMMPDGTVIEY